MIKVNFFEDNIEECVLALGFFDAVHRGHVRVLSTCVALAKELETVPVAFTFDCNPSNFVKDKDDKLICSYSERLDRFSDIGIKKVLSAPCEKKFFDIKPIDFLDFLRDRFHAKGIVCGYDYRFGAGGVGDVAYLKEYCEKNGIILRLVDELRESDQKIGSSNIKEFIKSGLIEKANSFLGYNYFVSGKVLSGRGDGKKLVVPTVNLSMPNDKVVPKRGVYYTLVKVDEIVYKGLTNVGAHPTFCDNNENVETFILDFNGDLYGKTIRVEFVSFLREIEKFSTPQELREQIIKDELKVRSAKW
ncbi:MAG: bifunctional riboflavin kinase/FAD synthetase [Clostridia bacterium]|nr:bifunctional riboflavin kinase/FAD synthetase [Clostridia bacterium]